MQIIAQLFCFFFVFCAFSSSFRGDCIAASQSIPRLTGMGPVHAAQLLRPFQWVKKARCMLRNSPALFKGGGTGAGYLKPET